MHRDLHGSELVSGPLPYEKLPPLAERFRRASFRGSTFRNPILPAPSSDPWIIRHDGVYYHCESRRQNSIWIRRTRNLTELQADEGHLVWTAPATGGNSNSVWAPELHRIDGRWFIYFAADNGLNKNHRLWILESATNDPTGPYLCRGSLETGGWAIDPTLFTHSGALYLLWSGWPGRENGWQNLYIARMDSPLKVATPRSLIAQPEEPWERVDMAICEAPQILQREGRTFLIYSASGSWTCDYCLGLLELTGTDPLNARAWTKHGRVFHKTDRVWGIGHCSFVRSPDDAEDWIVYHAKSKRKEGWNDRDVRAQRFTWTLDGRPNFGAPVPAGVPMNIPSAS